MVALVAIGVAADHWGLVNLGVVPLLRDGAYFYLLLNASAMAPLVLIAKFNSIIGVSTCPRCHQQLKERKEFTCPNCGPINFGKPTD